VIKRCRIDVSFHAGLATVSGCSVTMIFTLIARGIQTSDRTTLRKRKSDTHLHTNLDPTDDGIHLQAQG